MLSTFAALVMGLLTVSVRLHSMFEQRHGELPAERVQVDELLRKYGLETDAARGPAAQLPASVIATTWTNETLPAGDYHLKKVG